MSSICIANVTIFYHTFNELIHFLRSFNPVTVDSNKQKYVAKTLKFDNSSRITEMTFIRKWKISFIRNVLHFLVDLYIYIYCCVMNLKCKWSE